jgi:hypothetical protein
MGIVRLTYKLNSGHNVIDIARGLSITERRMIHQKQVFTVMGGMLVDDAPGTKIKLSTAPNNFYTRNAVTRGFRAWKAMRAKALEADSSAKTGKYADFKVHLDQSTTYLRPFSAGSVQLGAGEWNYSDVTPDSGAGKELMIVGNQHTATRYCLAQGWLETRELPDDASPGDMPDLDSDGNKDFKTDFLGTLFQDTTESLERLVDIHEENDYPPFERTELMTTQSSYSTAEPNNLQLQCVVHNSQNDVANAVPGFQALCGLVRVDVTGGTNPILIIDVDTKGWNF